MRWEPEETRWLLHYVALLHFLGRTGGLDIPEHHVEELPDAQVLLYAWAVRQRYARRTRPAAYDPNHARLLEQVPGWLWERPDRRRRSRIPLPIVKRHGTSTGYTQGCGCDPCTEANAQRNRAHAGGLVLRPLVDAGPVRGNLRMLEGQVGPRSRPAMKRLSGLNKKTIDELINGDRKRVTADVRDVLLALTAAALRDDIAARPSERDQLPAAPTVALLDDLIGRGWSRSWIANELGNAKSLQIGKTGAGTVRRSTAETVERLHTAVGDRTPPPRRWRAPMPSLAEILANEQVEGAA